MSHYALALDLIDDEPSIAEYQRLHQRIWPEVAEHLRSCGVRDMQIWRLGTRLFMSMQVDAAFSFEAMDEAAAENPKVQAWETLMSRYQTPTPWTASGVKWQPMQRIFALTEQPGF